jgi:hypothetical protein
MTVDISAAEIEILRQALAPLIGIQFKVLQIPKGILVGFEPSQIGTIVGTLMDACIPYLSEILPGNESLAQVGLIRHMGEIGEREGYPDYDHISGKRVELKLLYLDPIDVKMKRPPTPREPSARLTQKVTVKNVDPGKDVLLVIAYQLKPVIGDPDLFSPTIVDIGVFSVIECIRARDERLLKNGRWFGNYDTPVVLSKKGLAKKLRGEPLDDSTYGRKEDENKDYNEDTNFGKLARIPYKPLQDFLRKHGYKVLGTRQGKGIAESVEEYTGGIEEQVNITALPEEQIEENNVKHPGIEQMSLFKSLQ